MHVPSRTAPLLLLVLILSVGVVACTDTPIAHQQAMTLQARQATEVLPPDVRFVGMTNVQAMRENETLDVFSEGLPLGHHADGEAAARLQSFLDATGFDLERDLREVYVAVPSHPDGPPSIVIYAQYDRDRLETFVEEELDSELTRGTYRGMPVYHGTRSGHEAAFALANENMLVASPSLEQVHTMLDRMAGNGDALKDAPATMRLVERVAGGHDGWFIVRRVSDERARPSRAPEDASGLHRQMKQAGNAVGDVAVGIDARAGDVRGTAWLFPASNVDPGDLTDLTKGIIAAMRSQPDLSDAHRRVLDDIEVRQVDGAAHVSGRLDNEVIASLRE